MGCRLPGGAADHFEFWDFLKQRGEGIVRVPEDRWSLDAFYDTEATAIGRARSKHGGFIKDIYGFDSDFFDISPREAENMDPQQRLLLEVVYEALQDANVPISAAARSRAGVFVGISTSDYRTLQENDHYRAVDEIFAGTGTALCIAANRISHRFNFTGPSYSIDTACSSSMVAVDAACRNLRTGTCDMAVAAGVNALISPLNFVVFSKANMLSPTGRLSTFDTRADGFVRGEGVGVVILKRLSDALVAGDHVYAVIRGTCVNQDGRTRTLTAPSQVSQMSMLNALCRVSGVDPERVGYVEAHGTGTPAGDPIEAGAIGRTFAKERARNPLWIGSVKPNVGHLESGAGIVGLIKAAMTVYTGEIAPNINFEVANPNIPFDALGMRVPVDVEELPSVDGERYAVANSFGFGGTNASALVQSFRPGEREHVPPRSAVGVTGSPVLVPLSAASDSALKAKAMDLADAVGRTGALSDLNPGAIAAGLAHGRDHFDERCVVLARDKAELHDRLAGFARGTLQEPGKNAVRQVVTGRVLAHRKLAFTFGGQGSQWWAMGRRLLEQDAVYRQAVDDFDALFEPRSGWRTRDAMLASQDKSRVDDSTVTQATICSLQIALARLWECRGVVPDLILGHSLGEAAAAHVAGALDLETTVRFIATRSLIRDHLGAEGAMAAVAMSAEDVALILPEDGSIDITGYNSPGMVSIGGDRAAILAFVEWFQTNYPGIFCRLLATDTAWHSHHLAAGENWFRNTVGSVDWSVPKIPIVSTVTGRLETCFDLDYLWANLAKPVMYSDAIDLAIDLGANVFLEVSPHRTLTGLTSAIANERGVDVHTLNSLHREQDALDSVAEATAELHVRGVPVDWSVVAPRAGTLPKLPNYPWENRPLENLSEFSRRFLFDGHQHPLLGRCQPSFNPAWMRGLNSTGVPFLADHRLEGEALFPATGYLEIAIAAGLAHFGSGPIELEDMVIGDALFVAPDADIRLRTEIDPERNLVRMYSRQTDTNEEWQLRCQCVIRQRAFDLPDVVPLSPPSNEGVTHVGQEDWYRNSDSVGFVLYGPAFRVIRDVYFDREEEQSFAVVQAHPSTLPGFAQYHAHPALLDAALQLTEPNLATIGAGGTVFTDDGFVGKTRYIPRGARRVVFLAPFEPEVFSLCRWTLDGDKIVEATTTVYNKDGKPLAFIEGVLWNEVPAPVREEGDDGINVVLLEEVVTPVSVADPAGDSVRGRRVVVLTGTSPHAEAMIAELRLRGADVLVVEKSRIDRRSVDTMRAAFADLIGGRDAPDQVVITWPLDHVERSDTVAVNDLLADVEPDILALVALGQAYLADQREPDVKPKLTVLTCGATTADREELMPYSGLTQSPLVPLLRSLAIECEQTERFTLVDVTEDLLASPGAIAGVLLSDNAERLLIYRDGRWHGGRLVATSFDDLPARQMVVSEGDRASNFMVTIAQPGLVDNLEIRQIAAHDDIGPDEVVVAVKAVGLNFRDVMAVTGLLPREAEAEDAHRNLGLEFAGVVEAVGSAVTALVPGDRVMGMNKRCLQRFLKVSAGTVVKLAPNLTFAEASTLPSAFVTAHYALNHVARLKARDRVLIHVATGGVGLAAIQLAQQVGAEIFATAGSEEKRQYLRDLGIKHVMNSRSLDFADEIMKITGGEGVDVILNSLPDHFIKKALDVLAPYGRYIEIGKRDVYADTPIGMKALRRNVQMAVLDLAALGFERPAYMRDMMDEISAMLAQGQIKPLPLTSYPVSEVTEAFRHMTLAKHIGKVVVDFDEPMLKVSVDASMPFALDRDASYLVTGGSRGFGLAVAQWLSSAGAGRVVLGSRSGRVDQDAAAVISDMEARGTIVDSVQLDVTDAEAVDAMIGQLLGGDKPLGGIVHGAALIDDGLLDQLDDDHIVRVLRPKIAGAWNLHTALQKRNADLRFFISFSSTAQLFGARGQANYVAANGFLDAFAKYRRGVGREGLTVAWGPLSGAGFVARNAALANYLESAGLQPVPAERATRALGEMLHVDTPVVGFGGFDWSRFARANPEAAADSRTAALLDGAGSGNKTGIVAKLNAAPRASWPALMSDFVAGEIVKVLKSDVNEIPEDMLLTGLGLDSLSSFVLKNRIEAELNVGLPVSKFVQAPTLGKLSKLLTEVFSSASEAAEGSAAYETTTESRRDGATVGGFRPSDRQVGLVAMSLAPMSSVDLCDALESTAIQDVELAGDSAQIRARANAAVAALCRAFPLLRLRIASKGSSDQLPTLDLGEPPAIELVDAAPDYLPMLDLNGGALARITMSLGETLTEAGTRRCAVALIVHRSVLEPEFAASVLLQLCTLMTSPGEASGPAGDEGQSVLNLLRSRSYDEGDHQSQSHKAFWYETLTPFAAAIALPKRKRALAPSGAGRNAGRAACVALDIELAAPPDLSSDAREARVLTALAQTLQDHFHVESVVVDRILPDLEAVRVGAAAGPHAVEVPLPIRGLQDRPINDVLARTERHIGAIEKHLAFDLMAIEQAFRSELQNAAASLSQIAFVDRDRFARQGWIYDVAPNGVALHDLLVELSTCGDGPGYRLTLVYDRDAVAGETALSIVNRLAEVLIEQASEPGAVIQGAPRMAGTARHVALANAVAPRPARRRDQGAAPHATRSRRAASTRVSVFPASAWQTYTLRTLDDPRVTDSFKRFWTLQYATSYNVSLDANRLNAVFNELAAKHETLRLRMRRSSTGWQAIVDPEHRTGVRVFDLGDVSEAEIQRELASRSNEPFDVEAGPLLTLDLLKCGARGDILHFRAHHLVVDGWSQLILFDDLVKAYLGLPGGFGQPIEFGAFLERERAAIANPNADAYWADIIHPVLPAARLGRVAKGLEINGTGAITGETARLTVTLDRSWLEDAAQNVRNANISLNALVTSAFATALCELGGVEGVYLNNFSAGRSSLELRNLIAPVADYRPIRCVPGEARDVETLARSVYLQQLNGEAFSPARATTMDPDIDRAVADAGGYLRQFHCGMLLPETQLDQTYLASLTRAQSGETIEVGPLKYRMLDLPETVYTFRELDLRFLEKANGLELRLSFETEAYTSDEAQRILALTVDRLGARDRTVGEISRPRVASCKGPGT